MNQLKNKKRSNLSSKDTIKATSVLFVFLFCIFAPLKLRISYGILAGFLFYVFNYFVFLLSNKSDNIYIRFLIRAFSIFTTLFIWFIFFKKEAHFFTGLCIGILLFPVSICLHKKGIKFGK